MRTTKVILAALLAIAAAQSVVADDCAARHASIAERIAVMQSDEQLAGVESMIRAVIAAGCGEVRDYVILRRAADQRGEFEVAADLMRQAMSAPDVATSSFDLPLYRAADLVRAGRVGEAQVVLRSDAATRRFRTEWLTLSNDESKWRRNEPTLPADLLAAAEAFDAESEIGARYRRAAAVTALEWAFLSSVYGPDHAVLTTLGVAAEALPLDSFDIAAQMTALRAEAIAYGSMHEIPHAIAALEQLFDLCYPDEIRRPCPAEGYAPVMLQSLVPFDRTVDAQAIVDYDNFHVAGWVADSAFRQISWDEFGGRRSSAKDDDFRGMLTVERRPYGGEVDAEEDRETIQDSLLLLRANDSLLIPASKRPEILVKTYLVEIEFTLQFGSFPWTPIVTQNAFLGHPIEEVEAIVERPHSIGGVAGPTWDAFDAARRERMLFRRLWIALAPDSPSARVWQLYWQRYRAYLNAHSGHSIP